MTRRRWIADSWDEATASIAGNQAEHLIRVLRAQAGMEFDLVAGGHVWHAVIAGIADGTVRFNLIAEVEADPALPVTLLLSIYKFDRMEWAIEKCTELGVARIVPVAARRTEAHLATAALKRWERWQRIAVQASEQSRRSAPPEISPPVKFKEALAWPGQIRIVLAEGEEQQMLEEALISPASSAAVVLAIGPEGGWAGAEIDLFRQAGWVPVSLGPTILRAETAAIAAMAVVMSCLRS
jgi:16S rRNA (uracil1498-N3)-methyltransferase